MTVLLKLESRSYRTYVRLGWELQFSRVVLGFFRLLVLVIQSEFVIVIVNYTGGILLQRREMFFDYAGRYGRGVICKDRDIGKFFQFFFSSLMFQEIVYSGIGFNDLLLVFREQLQYGYYFLGRRVTFFVCVFQLFCCLFGCYIFRFFFRIRCRC